MNTDKLLATLQAPPCNWRIIDAPGNVTPADSKIGQSPEAAATISIRGDGSGVTMRCAFAPDMPEQTAARNLNYLLTVALVLGGNEAYKAVLEYVQSAAKSAEQKHTYSWIENGLFFNLTIDETASMTTLDIREYDLADATAIEVKERAE